MKYRELSRISSYCITGFWFTGCRACKTRIEGVFTKRIPGCGIFHFSVASHEGTLTFGCSFAPGNSASSVPSLTAKWEVQSQDNHSFPVCLQLSSGWWFFSDDYDFTCKLKICGILYKIINLVFMRVFFFCFFVFLNSPTAIVPAW